MLLQLGSLSDRSGQRLAGLFVRIAAQVQSWIDTPVHFVGGRILAHVVQTRHDGHFAVVRLDFVAGHSDHVLRYVDDASQNVPAGRQFAGLEQVARQHRERNDRNEGQDHGQRAEWEQLLRPVPSGVVDERRQVHQRLATRHPGNESDDVRRHAAVRVAVVLEVDDDEQLREQDDVDQVGAQVPAQKKTTTTQHRVYRRAKIDDEYLLETIKHFVVFTVKVIRGEKVYGLIDKVVNCGSQRYLPQAVDGGHSQRHGRCHGSRDEDGNPHDPHDLMFRSLYRKRRDS